MATDDPTSPYVAVRLRPFVAEDVGWCCVQTLEAEQQVVVSVPLATVVAALVLIQVLAKQLLPDCAFQASHLLEQQAVAGLLPATVVAPLTTGYVPEAQSLPLAESQASHLSEQHVERNMLMSPLLSVLDMPVAPALSHVFVEQAHAAPPHAECRARPMAPRP